MYKQNLELKNKLNVYKRKIDKYQSKIDMVENKHNKMRGGNDRNISMWDALLKVNNLTTECLNENEEFKDLLKRFTYYLNPLDETLVLNLIKTYISPENKSDKLSYIFIIAHLNKCIEDSYNTWIEKNKYQEIFNKKIQELTSNPSSTIMTVTSNQSSIIVTVNDLMKMSIYCIMSIILSRNKNAKFKNSDDGKSAEHLFSSVQNMWPNVAPKLLALIENKKLN